jgi:hypothetical protein
MPTQVDASFRRRALTTCIGLVVICVGASPLRAEIVFTNIVGNCCGGQGINGVNFGEGSAASAFIAASPYRMTDAEVMVFQSLGFGGDPYFNISLYSDADGVPSDFIASLGTRLTAPVGGGIVTASDGMPLLDAGTQYWLVLSPSDALTDVGWEQGGDPLALQAELSGGGRWHNGD